MIHDSRNLWVGIGCQRGTSYPLIKYALVCVCQGYHLDQEAIAGFATIDLKATEPCLLQLCFDMGLPLKTYTSVELGSVEVATPSSVVNFQVGTTSVAEAAALLAASAGRLLVSKQIVKLSGQTGGVTVAIAQSEKIEP